MPYAATWMDMEDVMLKRNKSDRVRQILYDITYILDSKKYKKQMNITKKKHTHRYSEQTRGYKLREREG